MKLTVPAVVLFFSVLISCNPSKRINKDFNYFQRGLDSLGTVHLKEPVIQPNDLLSITVYSKSLNQEQALLFNIPNTGVANSGGGASQNSTGYLVDMAGNIEMPLVGRVKAAALTRTQLSELLSDKIALYVKDPEILVRFLQFRVNVLGEVKSPGTKNFQTDRVTVIDALGAAGDLTDAGKREDVLVIRENNGQRQSYKMDLRSGLAFQSPVFQLQQNDIVYVGANTNKLKVVNTNPNFQRDLGIGLSIATFIVLLVNLINVTK